MIEPTLPGNELPGASDLWIDRKELLAFYDTLTSDNRTHANSVSAVAGEELGMGLLKHCLEQSRGAKVDLLETPCTPRTRKGSRLDGWMRVQYPTDTVLYQIEVKNWSAHSIGGKQLSLDATPSELTDYRQNRWLYTWDTRGNAFWDKPLAKVLEPMFAPESWPVEPVACLWTALHPTGDDQFWFSVPLPDGLSFSRVWFFSMSAYLRSLDDARVLLNMPKTAQRKRWLDRLFLSTP